MHVDQVQYLESNDWFHKRRKKEQLCPTLGKINCSLEILISLHWLEEDSLLPDRIRNQHFRQLNLTEINPPK